MYVTAGFTARLYQRGLAGLQGTGVLGRTALLLRNLQKAGKNADTFKQKACAALEEVGLGFAAPLTALRRSEQPKGSSHDPSNGSSSDIELRTIKTRATLGEGI